MQAKKLNSETMLSLEGFTLICGGDSQGKFVCIRSLKTEVDSNVNEKNDSVKLDLSNQWQIKRVSCTLLSNGEQYEADTFGHGFIAAPVGCNSEAYFTVSAQFHTAQCASLLTPYEKIAPYRVQSIYGCARSQIFRAPRWFLVFIFQDDLLQGHDCASDVSTFTVCRKL